MTNTLIHEQSKRPLANYLRTHRRRTGLTQHELARVLGYGTHSAIARHERLESVPSLAVALRYQVLYRVPVSEIFAGLVKVLSSILSPDNGPYAVLAWTKHPEIRELFEQHVFARPDVT
jgi:DNA-binding XRE family transcriptional regulator